MEERFDLSWNNKEVRMWCYIMIPILLVDIFFIVTSEGPLSPILYISPTIGWILYGIWRYFFKRNQKKR